MELAIILIFGFLIFGPEKLPQVAKTAVRFVQQFRNAQEQMTKVIQKEVVEPMKDLEPLVNPFSGLDLDLGLDGSKSKKDVDKNESSQAAKPTNKTMTAAKSPTIPANAAAAMAANAAAATAKHAAGSAAGTSAVGDKTSGGASAAKDSEGNSQSKNPQGGTPTGSAATSGDATAGNATAGSAASGSAATASGSGVGSGAGIDTQTTAKPAAKQQTFAERRAALEKKMKEKAAREEA
jgi:colicin import membrane protein